jgi:argininosuccinate synthase
LWYSPLRRALDAFVTSTQQTVTGTVRVKLFKGSAVVVGRRAPTSLYRHELATFGRGAGYNQGDAEGFIRLFGLPTKVFADVNPELSRDLTPPRPKVPTSGSGPEPPSR